jgi:hypothetical protein
MIIEISGLPEGQKIKNISVNVKFEDGVAEIKTSTESTESTESIDDIAQQIIEDNYQASIKGIGESFDKRVEDMMEEESTTPPSPPPIRLLKEGEASTEPKREPIPIPPEMTDQQF